MIAGSWFLSEVGGPTCDVCEVGASGNVVDRIVVAQGVPAAFARLVVGEHNTIRQFIRQRQEYVNAALDSSGDSGDYRRWQGHMGSRRQIAQSPGVPHEFAGGAS